VNIEQLQHWEHQKHGLLCLNKIPRVKVVVVVVVVVIVIIIII
jgi:hypothetical protein